MSKNIVNCDSCKEDFAIEVQEVKARDNISKVFFSCPHCGAEYLVHYTTKEIKAKQKAIRNAVTKVGDARKKNDSNKAERYFNRYKELKKELEQAMNELEKKMS